MRKARNKKISLLMAIVFLFTIVVPLVGPAAAATGLRALSAPTVDDDSWERLGRVILEVEPEALRGGDTVIFSLPSGFDFAPSNATFKKEGNSWELSVVDGVYKTVYSAITVPDKVSGTLNDINIDAIDSVSWLDDNQISLKMKSSYTPVTNGELVFLQIDMNEVYIDDGHEGDIEFTSESPSGSGFPDDSVVVGTTGDGRVTISVVDDQTSNDDFDVTLRIKESLKGDIDDEKKDSIKFTLPDGFEWNETDGGILDYDTVIWGDDGISFTMHVDEEEIELELNRATNAATYFEITLSFLVADETDAEYGDIVAKVGGRSDVSPSEIVVGTYGDYDATIEVDGDVAEVFAGKNNQELPDIVIEEGMKGSLINGRTVNLTLPSNARWVEDTLEDTSKDEGIYLEFTGFTGTNDRTAKFKVAGAQQSTGAAELTIDDLEIMLESGKTGEVVVEVSGSAGLDGELVVADAIAPVTIDASALTTVQIGKANQAVGDLTITEVKEGAIKDDPKQVRYNFTEVDAAAVLTIDLTEGVSFSALPTVEVVEGDLKIDEQGIYRKNSAEGTKDNQLVIPIDNDSDEPSTIKITNVTYTVDRTVPEGNITVAVVGASVNETGGSDVLVWPNARAAAATSNATVGTPAPGDSNMAAAFVLGSTTYTVNGVEQTMDVAPYAKDGRTYLPVRYVGYALGVADSNIMYDSATQTVTMLKGDKVVQITIGSKNMVVNGATIAMDVAPEAVDGRTMLPFRWIAWAFGASVEYDAATQTVSMNL